MASKVQRPQTWKYVAGFLLTLLILIPAWILFVMLVIRPDTLMGEQALNRNWFWWWIVMPAVAVMVVFGWRWKVVSDRAVRAETLSAQALATQQALVGEQSQREYVLEVISVGVTLDKYRQGSLWEALKEGNPRASIREQDPKNYPWSAGDKAGQEGGRSCDTLENGAKTLPSHWGIPSFYADSPFSDLKEPVSESNPAGGLVGCAESSGMGYHRFVIGPWELAERPDHLLARVFDFFDAHPDVPLVVLSAADGMYFRDLFRLPGTSRLIRDGYYVPEMPDSSTLLVLARRERVEVLRPYVFEDADEVKLDVDELAQRGYAWRMTIAYNRLSQTFPKMNNYIRRMPTVKEWLAATQAFAQREDIYPKTFSALASDLNPFAGDHPPRGYKPTPWFPIPWNTEQLARIDAMPTLGYLHRPVFVPTVDEQGRPLAKPKDRAAALAAGWAEALKTLPEAERKTAPARVAIATGGNTAQTVAFHTVLNEWAEHGGPALDVSKPTQWIDTDARLGNTGAATWFMQMAIGVMGSYREGGVTAAVNLRDAKEASIVLISPPPDDKRKSQRHPRGGDVFRHHASPAVDPANYSPP